MTDKMNNNEKLLFDYFLNELDFYKRQDIKTSKELIEHYRENITIKDNNERDCSCCGGGRDIIDDD